MTSETEPAISKKKADKDERLPKQFGDFAEMLVMYALGHMRGMSVALIDHVGADIIAADRDTGVRYAISVKGRNIPDSESKGYNFGKADIDKLKETAEVFGMEAAVALVFTDTHEKGSVGEDKKMRIRILVAKLKDIEDNLKSNDLKFMHDRVKSGGFYTKYQTGSDLDAMKKCGFIDYIEFELMMNEKRFPSV